MKYITTGVQIKCFNFDSFYVRSFDWALITPQTRKLYRTINRSHCWLFSCQASTDWCTSFFSFPTTADIGLDRPTPGPKIQNVVVVTKHLCLYKHRILYYSSELLRKLFYIFSLTLLTDIRFLLPFIQEGLSWWHLAHSARNRPIIRWVLVETLLGDVTDRRKICDGAAGHFLGCCGPRTLKERVSSLYSL